MIELTIDEKKVSVEANTTILEAARSVGVYIPTLCEYKGLSPIGSCRVCVVEVEGERKPVASCHVPAANGMVVKTDTPKLWELRKMMVELILATHPLDCPTCDKGGECELQDITHAFDIKAPKYILNNPDRTKAGANPFLYLDFQKCIQCIRCAHYTEEVEGVKSFDYHGSGGYSVEIDKMIDRDTVGESAAGVIAVCPVGSLLDRPFKQHSKRNWDLTTALTTCPHCPDGCQIILNTAENEIFRVTAPSETDFSQGHPCLRGRFGFGFVKHTSRLKAPLMRVNDTPKEVGWDEAFSFAASRIKEIKEKHGPDSIWGVPSPRLVNEEQQVFDSLFSRMGANVVLFNGIGRSSLSGVREVMGDGYVKPLAYIDESDLVLIAGVDLTETNPFIANRVSRNARLKESKAIVVNPRKIELRKAAWRHLAPRPGTEAALLTWIGKLVGARLKPAPAMDWLDKVDEAQLEALTGVGAAVVREAAKALSDAKRPCIIVGDDPSCGDNRYLGTAAANLLILTGKAGAEGSGIFPVLDECNSWGAMAVHKDARDRKALFEAMQEGRVKALYLAGEDPLGDWPAGWGEAMKKVDFLMVQDSNMTKTAEVAHLVLHSRSFAESVGKYSDHEGRERVVNECLKPYDAAKSGFEIINELGKRLLHSIGDSTEKPARKPENIPSKNTVQIPMVSAPKPNKDYPFLLLTGRKLYGSYSLFERCKPLYDAAPEAILEMNSEDAGRMNLTGGSRVRISSEGGSVEVKVSVMDAVLSSNLYLPIHPKNGSQRLFSPDGSPCFVNIAAVV